MGRLAKSTDDEIIAAGIAIENEGKPVSTFAIRNNLKGGCSDRIKLVWNEFIEQRGYKELEIDVGNKIDLPPELQDLLDENSILLKEKLTMLALECYRVSQVISKERINSLTENYKEKISYFESAEQQAMIAINLTDQTIEKLEVEIEITEQRYQSQTAEVNKCNGIIETLEKRLQRLEMREDEHLKLQRQFGTVEAQLKSLEKQAEG